MNILVAGSRNFKNLDLIERWLHNYFSVTHDVLISGGANGVDSVAENWLDNEGGNKNIFYPDWETHGKKAGPLRNEQMVKAADMVVVFWDATSKGTKSTIDYALKYKKHLEVIYSE